MPLPSPEYVVLDVGDFRWITSLTIKSKGDRTSPKNCLLQSSATGGVGPFLTLATFRLADSTDDQTVTGFSGHARYFRLMVLDNHGGATINIRQLALDGYSERISVASFAIDNTGAVPSS